MGIFTSKSVGLDCGIIGDKITANSPYPCETDPRWKSCGKVTKLYVYPVKSCCGISVHNAIVEKHGLRHGSIMDRQFLVVDHNQKFVTARQYSKLVLIKVKIEGKSVILEAPNMDSIAVCIPQNNEGTQIETTVWGKKCWGLDLGPEVGQWIGNYLEKPHLQFRMLFHDYGVKSSTRELQNSDNPVVPMTKGDDVPLFADGYGFLLINNESINGLNKMLKKRNVDLTVEHRRFRPNILVDGTDGPFDEDDWLFIRINGIIFRNASYCARCVFTTVDPDVGQKNPEGEPLKTLKSFRASLDPREIKEYQNSPFFGINLGVENFGGHIHTNDQVFVIKREKQGSNLLLHTLKWLPLPLIILYLWREDKFLHLLPRRLFSRLIHGPNMS